MKLLIISPQHKESYTVQSLEAYTSTGALVIQPGHAPIMLTLVAGHHLSFVLKTGETKSVYLTRPGFLDVDRTMIAALINEPK